MLFSISVEAYSNSNVPNAYIKIGNKYGVPPEILYSIAYTESKAKVSYGAVMPWPWTINVKGQGIYFRNANSMKSRIESLIDRGENSFDAGVMQVNWKYHKNRFRNVDELIDPIKNIEAAAQFLSELIKATGSIKAAIGMYHTGKNGSKKRQIEYYMKVMNNYRKYVRVGHEIN